MIEKVNPSHPDKIADIIAGAIVDLAYKKEDNPKIAVEVLIGHNECNVIVETNVIIAYEEIDKIVKRISKSNDIKGNYKIVPQDINLASNQNDCVKCGDNGIFKGVPLTEEQKEISKRARRIYSKYPYDGKYILTYDKFIICQSNAKEEDLRNMYPNAVINPLGYWTGGINVDSGATNRKLGSDMGDSITGGGLHGKDLSKADVTLNIYAFKKAQETKKEVKLYCAIGDKYIDNRLYKDIVDEVKLYINKLGGFEKFAEWGLF